MTTYEVALFEAIAGRRAIRAFEPGTVDDAIINQLLDTAVMAPSALNSQPWVFAVLEGKTTLEVYSDRAKQYYLDTFSPGRDPHTSKHDELNDPRFNVFFGAPLAIVIYSRPMGQFSSFDCCLAAQNLMLAAHALGLGSCPVGYAQGWCDTEEVKAEFGIDPECSAVLPIALGKPAERPSSPGRREPTVVWPSRVRPGA